VHAGELALLTPEVLHSSTAACLIEVDNLADPHGEWALTDSWNVGAYGRTIALGIRSHLGYGAPLVDITHAGGYRLAYDRTSAGYGIIEPEPGRSRRRFRGTQTLQNALNAWAAHIPDCAGIPRSPAYVLTGGLRVSKPGHHGAGTAVDVDGFWWSATDKYSPRRPRRTGSGT